MCTGYIKEVATLLILSSLYEDMRGEKICQTMQVSPNFMVCICIYEAIFFVIIALSCIPSVQYFVVSWCLIDISLLLIPELYPVYELTTTQPNKTTIDT